MSILVWCFTTSQLTLLHNTHGFRIRVKDGDGLGRRTVGLGGRVKGSLPKRCVTQLLLSQNVRKFDDDPPSRYLGIIEAARAAACKGRQP